MIGLAHEAVPVRSIAPPLRLLALAALDGRHEIDGLTVQDQSPRNLDLRLKIQSDDLLVRIDEDVVESHIMSQLYMPQELSSETISDILQTCLALGLWDQAVSEELLFRGNIYMADERAVVSLRNLLGMRTSADLTYVLDLMQSAELLYRFPVAYKFRGAYGLERQCRLNGWGRRVFGAISSPEYDPEFVSQARERMSALLTTSREQYLEVILRASEAKDDSTSERVWTAAQALPVPILV